MRKLVGMLSLGALAACSGTEPQSAGSVAATGTQTTAGTFVSPNETKTYKAQGATQSYGYTSTERSLVSAGSRTLVADVQSGQLYQANAATVRDPGMTISYDPRSAQFTLTIAQGSLSQNITFQDPAHRTDFGGALHPQAGVPNIAPGVNYLQVALTNDGSAYDAATFFYEKPGTTTQYVTYAGYVRNRVETPTDTVVADTANGQLRDAKFKVQLDRAAFVYGEQTANSAVPTTGTATYSGNMIASTINSPDFESKFTSYYQWITGTATTTVDFAAASVKTAISGTVGTPFDPSAVTTVATIAPPATAIPAGATFAANAAGKIDLVGKGGFTGTFSDASFTSAGKTQQVTIAGSSLDGAFYGPKAEEVGGSFRVVGGVPDQRVDVIGAFTGKK